MKKSARFLPKHTSALCEWCWRNAASIHRCGQPSNRFHPGSDTCARPCENRFADTRSRPEWATAYPVLSSIVTRRWIAWSRSCVKSMRSSRWPVHFSPRRSSNLAPVLDGHQQWTKGDLGLSGLDPAAKNFQCSQPIETLLTRNPSRA